jgi:MFS family permease
MFTPYRRLFSTPGGLRFSLAGFIGRMSISMDSLALVFIVVHATHSYTLAGALAAVASTVMALALPFWGRVSDRIGQQKTLIVAIPLRVIFISVFIALVTLHAPTWTWFLSIIVAESTVMNLGGFVRRRWLFALGDDRELINTAYSYEGLMDEFVFLFGPVIATACAASIAPAAGLIVGLVFMAVGSTLFALQTKTEPPPHPRDDTEPHQPVMRNTSVQAVVLTTFFIGGFFNVVVLVVVAFAQEHHAMSKTGWLLAIWSVGSAIAATVNGAIKWKINHAKRYWMFLFGLVVLSIPFLFVHSLTFLTIALFCNGLVIAPLIVSAYAVAEAAVPPSQITETLSWVVAGMPLGGAVSSAVGGWVIDNYGAERGFWVPLACLIGAIVMSLPYFRTWNRLRSSL